MIRIASSTFYQQAVSSIDANQTQLSTVQQQMGSGLQMLTAADNPVAAGQVLSVNQSIADTTQWQSNATALSNSLGLENGALTSVGTALQQIQSLALQANNSGISASDRQAIAGEMQQQFDVILQQANAQDASGNYIFGGTDNSTAPFSQTSSGASYNGNSDVNMLALGPTSEIAAGDSGNAVFMQLKSGNGSIDVAAGTGNTGTAAITAASVASPGTYNGGSYSLQFGANNQYQVLDSGNNVVASGTYSAGNAISFAGLSVTLSGVPANGDSFTVSPATTQSLFATVQNLINTVASPGTGSAQTVQNQTAFFNALQSLSGAQAQINTVLAGVGARQQAVTSATAALQSRSTQLQSTLSSLQNLDYAKATAQYSQAQVTLQAAEQAYVQIQGLSLFNYIK